MTTLKQIKTISIGDLDSFKDPEVVDIAFIAMSQNIFNEIMIQMSGPDFSTEDAKKLDVAREEVFYRKPTIKYDGSVIGTLSHIIESDGEICRVTLVFNPITSN